MRKAKLAKSLGISSKKSKKEDLKLSKAQLDEKQKQEQLKKMQDRKIVVSLKSNETEIDALLRVVLEKGKIGLDQVVKMFKIDMSIAKDWAKILEDSKLIEINYTTFGAVILSKPKEVKKENGEV